MFKSKDNQDWPQDDPDIRNGRWEFKYGYYNYGQRYKENTLKWTNMKKRTKWKF